MASNNYCKEWQKWVGNHQKVLFRQVLIQSFETRIEAFKQMYIPDPAAVENQKFYLLRVKKNDKLIGPLFIDRLKQINLLISQFLGSSLQQCFLPDEIKRLFYFSMPSRWRTNFINSGHILHTTSTEALKTYMIQQEQQTDAHRKKIKKVIKDRFRTTTTRKDPTLLNSPTQKVPLHQVKAASKRRKKLLSNKDDCPMHGPVHKWGQYHQN